jgi:hypothetical protein
MTDIAIYGVSDSQFKREVQAALQLLQLPTYTVATLPDAATYPRGIIYVSDGASNQRMAISDGTNWRFPSGSIVS